jgi:hypothetical protein
VVVAVGLTLVEPLPDVDVNVPGVIAILVAPVVTQLNVLLAPEFMLVGTAAKDAIAGPEPFTEGEFDKLAAAQPARPTLANKVRTSAQRSSPEESRSRDLSLLPQNELGESISDPFVPMARPVY